MKEINIYTSGKCLAMSDKKPGSYAVKLEYKNKVKHLDGFQENTTSYRIIIIGIIEAIKCLKEPCKINLYNPTALGLKKILNKKGEYKTTSAKYNGDKLSELSELLKNNDHAIKEHITNEYIDELKPLHNKYKCKYKTYKQEFKSDQGESVNWNIKTVDNGIDPF